MTSDKQNRRLLWVDLETTGLDPEECQILEYAHIITGPGPTFEEIERVNFVMRLQPETPKMSDEVLQMHRANGLMNEVQASSLMVPEVADMVAQHLHREDYILAGSNPGFEMGFLLYHMPNVFERLHYSHFDVNALYHVTGTYGQQKPRPHRAMPDLERDLDMARKVGFVLRDVSETNGFSFQ